MTTPRHLSLRASVQTAEIRTATHDGRRHIVVPIVALIGDRAIQAMNAETPELVPDRVIAATPEGWGGRPVVPIHPTDNAGRPVSANDPVLLDRYCFGRVFNPSHADKRLRMEIWLDPDRAARVGNGAEDVVARAERRELFEVSVGAYVAAREETGVDEAGTEYGAIWSDLIPDHLAAGLDGAPGACSVEMGCGGPRVNQATADPRDPPSDPAGDPPPTQPTPEAPMTTLTSLVSRFVALIGGSTPSTIDASAREQLRAAFRAAQESMSDSDLREALWGLLQSTEPGFEMIVEVFPAETLVVYTTWTDEDGYRMWRRSYTVAGDDGSDVSIAAEKEEVEQVTEYQVVSASDPSPASPSAPCSCGADPRTKNPTASASTHPSTVDPDGEPTTGDDTMSKIKSLVEKLIAHGRSPFDKDDTPTLEGFSEEKLEAMLATCEEVPADPPVSDPDPPTEPSAPTAASQPNALSTDSEEYRSMKAAADAYHRQQEAEKTRLVGAISKVTDAFTEDELKAKTVAELTKLSAALKVGEPAPDYSGRPLPSSGDDNAVPPPPSLKDALAARASKLAN